ncbi:hypothetical protein HYH03_017278 [Edaphochlamys debaryana]|uniref:peptidylprolyl isomerase n=1 Tax=Edaphochlamys debaryana TaxID=47281 RepID=A0A835XI80_9CHLO|nr:hypothetical protein HYH03_017278 [Edaphochlamys debaryana]|eukprot:KAG2483884.1 hypothetical protein HYH03_017278 [Edaphochlamys debaryana]
MPRQPTRPSRSDRASATRVFAASGLQASGSGLQWRDLEAGSGPAPARGSTIRVHYRGRLDSGVVFDESYKRGRPFAFKVGAGVVIRGWDLGILGSEDIPPMREGGKRVLLIPPDLAYGEFGFGTVVPPGATLEFEVVLLPTDALALAGEWLAGRWKDATGFLDAV